MQYQKVYRKIWHDEKFAHLSPELQRFFLYVLTSPVANLAGIYVLKEGYACDDLGCTIPEFLAWVDGCEKAGLITYDHESKVILVNNYLYYNRLENPNQVKSAEAIIKNLPKTKLINKLRVLISNLPVNILVPNINSELINDNEDLWEPTPNEFWGEGPIDEMLQNIKHEDKSKSSNGKKTFSTKLPTGQEKSSFTFNQHQHSSFVSNALVDSGETVTIPVPVTDTALQEEREGLRERKHGANCIPYQSIIDDLNRKTGKRFIVTKDTRSKIRARWDDGFRLHHFEKVHSNMAAKWLRDPKMNLYLRPATLYCASKFEGYMNATVSHSDRGIISHSTERDQQSIQKFLEGEGE